MVNDNVFLFLMQTVLNSASVLVHSFYDVQWACKSEVYKLEILMNHFFLYQLPQPCLSVQLYEFIVAGTGITVGKSNNKRHLKYVRQASCDFSSGNKVEKPTPPDKPFCMDSQQVLSRLLVTCGSLGKNLHYKSLKQM